MAFHEHALYTHDVFENDSVKASCENPSSGNKDDIFLGIKCEVKTAKVVIA